MWAVRLVNGLVARGGIAGLVVHPEPQEQRALDVEIDERVRVWRIDVPRFGERPGGLSPYLPHYRAAVRALGRGVDSVVLSPNLHGDCYGVAAALCLADPEAVRVVGWQHSDNEYDARALMHYEAMLSRFVGGRDAIEAGLKEELAGGGDRGRDVMNVGDGGEVPERARRVEGSGEGGSGTLRLLYSGRLEHMQKRVGALISMSHELSRRGVDHSLTIAGDGPAMVEMAMVARGLDRVRMLGAVGPRRVVELLDEHDALVLPSRYEGLSVAVLEAMARGCVPIVARTRSGAGQAISPGVNGEIADVGPEAEEDEVGVAMAAAVQRFAGRDEGGRVAMARAAWERAGRFSVGVHVERVIRMMRDVVGEVWREWPRERDCAFSSAECRVLSAEGSTAAGARGTGHPPGRTMPPGVGCERGGKEVGGSGSVPADGAERMRAVLESLRGRAVAIHGTGEHTRQLRDVIVQSPEAAACA